MSTGKFGTLYLIPVNLSEPFVADALLPASVLATARRLTHFVAENAKTARAFLKAIGVTRPLAEISIVEIDKHAKGALSESYLSPLLAGHDVGLVSEAGAPAVADPGADIVALAHAKKIRVVPCIGPSSILLALMASGLNGQKFAFHGYLPRERDARVKVIQELERESKQKNMTQILIETPYRNQALLSDLANTLRASTRLCVAADLSGTSEQVATRAAPSFANEAAPSKPALFLFLAD